jgi:hypothetical protein
VWVSAGLAADSALTVGASVVAAVVAVAGFVVGRQTWRAQRREKSAGAIETTRNVIRDLQLLSREETPDPAMIEEVRQRWVERVRDELVKFTGAQKREIRNRGSGLAADVDEALRLARLSVSGESDEERSDARTKFDQLVPKLYKTARWLRSATHAPTESERARE